MKSKKEGDDYKIGMAGIDVFLKKLWLWLFQVKRKRVCLRLYFLKEIGKPKVLVADEEGGLVSNYVGDYLKKEGITYIVNRNHAPFVERYRRTLK